MPVTQGSQEGQGTQGAQGYDERAAAIAEEFAGHLVEAGMQRMAARVFACLFVDDDGALTAAELAARLQVSPGGISGAISYLSQVYLVTRERQPGSRRERYRLRPGVLYESIVNRSKIFIRWAETMRRGTQTLGTDTPAGHRLAETAEFLDFLRAEMEASMVRWRQHLEERADRLPPA
jgi:DNA-binding transcriptional ArsR family regulator